MRGREIQTEGGTKIGTVEDVILDSQAHLLGFALGKIFVQGPLAQKKIILREVVTNVGDQVRPMTTILARAEEAEIAEPEPARQVA